MAYILSTDIGEVNTPEDIQRFDKKWQEYHQYLESLRGRMPQSAFDFATASWHYDHEDPRGLHDSWVNSLTIREPARGERKAIRALEIEVRLLGPYHNGITTLKYLEVFSYTLGTPAVVVEPAENSGHGDWLYDEVRLAEGGHVLHEVEFSRGSRWKILCKDIQHIWEPYS